MTRTASATVFAALFLTALAFICRSHPQEFFPDDLYLHMSVIQQYLTHGRPFFFGPQELFIRPRWHHAWSFLFEVFNVANVDLYPRIIFRVQGLITFACMAYTGGRLYFITAKSKNFSEIMCVALFSTCFFFIGTGVISVSWFVRYGATYQVTLPLAFLVQILVLEMIVARKISIGRCFIAAILSAFILAFHAMEFGYILLFIGVTMVYYHRSVSFRKLTAGAIPTIGMVAALTLIPDVRSKFHFDFANGYVFDAERFSSCCSGLLLASLATALIGIPMLRWIRSRDDSALEIGPFEIYTIYSVLMILIPLPYVSKLVSFTPAYDIFRFYFGSAWFVLVPILFTTVVAKFSAGAKDALLAMVCLATFASCAAYLSKHSDTKTTWLNTQSILATQQEDRLTNWDHSHLKTVRDYLANQDIQNSVFIARSDIDLMINLLGGFTTFSDVQVAENGRIVKVERRSIMVSEAPAGYKLVKVPDLFEMDAPLRSIGWETSVSGVRPK